MSAQMARCIPGAPEPRFLGRVPGAPGITSGYAGSRLRRAYLAKATTPYRYRLWRYARQTGISCLRVFVVNRVFEGWFSVPMQENVSHFRGQADRKSTRL